MLQCLRLSAWENPRAPGGAVETGTGWGAWHLVRPGDGKLPSLKGRVHSWQDEDFRVLKKNKDCNDNISYASDTYDMHRHKTMISSHDQSRVMFG